MHSSRSPLSPLSLSLFLSSSLSLSSCIHSHRPTFPPPLTGGRDRHVAVTVQNIDPLVTSLEQHAVPFTLSKSGRRFARARARALPPPRRRALRLHAHVSGAPPARPPRRETEGGREGGRVMREGGWRNLSVGNNIHTGESWARSGDRRCITLCGWD